MRDRDISERAIALTSEQLSRDSGIRINDPGGNLQPKGPLVHPSFLLIGVWSEKGLFHPMTLTDALELVSRNEVPDLPDRIISATAVALRVPLVSRDGKIRASQIETIW